MADNTIRRCGQIGEGDDDEVSMQDVLEEQNRLQADASAVLGASDPHNCTYPKGYLKRQALYACATCTPNGNAGICLACSYACHEGHDLYELYTKRYFCCDCGNDKFPNQVCKLVKNKELNARNRYSQNFKGLYCSCSRPYPDEEDKIGDEMIQCIVCEDWYHARHLKTPVPDDGEEMICPECMSRLPFLWAYHVSSHCAVVKKEESSDINTSIDVGKSSSSTEDNEIENNNVNVETVAGLSQGQTLSVTPNGKENGQSDSNKENCGTKDGQVTVTDSSEGTSNTVACSSPCGVKRQREDDANDEEVKPKVLKSSATDENGVIGEETCLLQSLQKREYEVPEHAAFWTHDWRSKLCKCQDCMEMYKDKRVEYLADISDTISAYEESGPKDEPQEEAGEENLFAGVEGMHRIQQIEIARGVRDLKTDLNEFLQGFAREGKVVTETDIREFFQSLEQKRRQRMNLPQDNCR